DRTFFFAAVDIQKVDEPVQVLFSVLDTQKINGVPIRQTPEAKQLLGVAKEESASRTTMPRPVFGALDTKLFGNNQLSARFNYSNNNAKNSSSAGAGVPNVTNSTISNLGTEKDRTYTFVTQLTSVLKNNLVNEFRFQYSREERPRIDNGPGPEVTVRNLGSTVAVFGRLNFLPNMLVDHRYQFTNNVSPVKRH